MAARDDAFMNSPMRLDVVIPTYNRHEMLKRTLASLLAAEVPAGLDVRVTVVDNNSKDQTRRTVEEWAEKFGGRLGYVFETRQGRSPALNAGIAATAGDLVGTIDDDEEIDAGWYRCVHAAFGENEIDFIGGRCMPRWGAERPAWLPSDYPGVIGWVDMGDRVLAFDENYPGILMGGNAVLKRSIIERVGPYSTALGRTDKRLLTAEDEDMYERLRAAGARGLYIPGLVIYHYIPPERLTKRYYRRWCFWRGVSLATIDRGRRSPVAYLGGVPRYLYGRAARGLLKLARGAFGSDPAENFSHELAVWDFAGFFYGKHFYRAAR
jgi:glycosyltransferase involved in cell wall biosynthesis